MPGRGEPPRRQGRQGREEGFPISFSTLAALAPWRLIFLLCSRAVLVRGLFLPHSYNGTERQKTRCPTSLRADSTPGGPEAGRLDARRGSDESIVRARRRAGAGRDPDRHG